MEIKLNANKLKKIGVILAAGILAVSSLTSCSANTSENGNSQANVSPSESAASSAPSEGADAGMDYSDTLAGYESDFNEELNDLNALIERASSMSSSDDYSAWQTEYNEIQERIRGTATDLENIAADIPEELKETYDNLNDSVMAAYNQVGNFAATIENAVSGDNSTLQEDFTEFTNGINEIRESMQK